MVRMEHGLVEAVTFVTATHLTKSDSNKSAVAKIALVLLLAVIPAKTFFFLTLKPIVMEYSALDSRVS